MMVVPALIAGFYALYAAKSLARWRRPALAVALGSFAFVAWSWSELHELMLADAVWRELYAAGDLVYLTGTIVPRLVVFDGAMATTFATVAAWSVDARGRERLAVVALLARLISVGGAIWLWRAGFVVDGPVRAWGLILIGAVLIEGGAWLAVWRAGGEGALAVATGAGTAAIVAAVIVREAPRVALIEPTHAIAADAGGTLVFVLAFALGIAAIAWVVRVVRS